MTRLIWRRWRGRQPTGIDRVCLAYLRHFGPRSQAVIHGRGFHRILNTKSSQELFELLSSKDRSIRQRLVRGALANTVRLGDRGHARPYLNVGHTGLNAGGYRKWVASADVRPICLVHDLIPITHPGFCRAGEAGKHRERMRTVLSTAAGVIGNSEATLRELRDFARTARMPMPPTLAALLGIDPLRLPEDVSDPGRPTFVTIGTIEGRKNHLLLLDVWSRLIDRLGDATPRLIIVGQRGWEAQHVFDLLDRSEKLRGHVIEVSGCTDQELAQHLASARALLFPSRAEGYGLPLVEALSLGVPVIASALPVFRELAGDIPAYVDPLDSAAWETAIMDFAQSGSAARTAQITRIKSFRLPDWNSHFAAVERWLERLNATAQPDEHRFDECLHR